MTMYAQLPFFLRRMLALQAVLLFFMFTFSEVKLLEQRRKAAFFVPLLITGSYLFFQWDILANPEVPCYYLAAAGAVPAAVPCGLLALLSLAGLFFCRDVMNWERTHITPMSVKESVDTLPAGLCCSFDDGFPKLVNRRMEEICRSVTGEPLRDAEDFYRVLLSRALETSAEIVIVHVRTESTSLLVTLPGPLNAIIVSREIDFNWL